MSSLSSVRGSSVFSQIPIESIDGGAHCYSYSIELQKAFEESNSVAIWDLVKRGANPNQPLHYTTMIARVMTRDYVSQVLCVDWYRVALKNDYPTDSLDNIQDKEIKDQLENIIARLQSEEVVLDNEIIDISNALYVAEAFQAHGEGLYLDVRIHPLIVALMLHDYDLARALIEAGADIKDPLFLEGLDMLCINEQYQNTLDFLLEQGLGEDDLINLMQLRQEFEWAVLGAQDDADCEDLEDFFDEEITPLPLIGSQKV